jgi:Uma2 family endonuclease
MLTRMIQTAKFSVKDYHRLVETGIFGDRQIELLEGNLIELSPETPDHANRNHKLHKYLLARFDGLADVRSAHPITLESSEPQPDIVLARLPDSLYDQRHPQPQDIDLIIEISLSTLNYDLNEKKRIYAKSGIKEYWIADLKHRCLIVFRNPIGSDYLYRTELPSGILFPAAFPQVQLEIDRFFQ